MTITVWIPLLIFVFMMLVLWAALVLIAPEIWRGIDFIVRKLARLVLRIRRAREVSGHRGEEWKLRFPFIFLIAIGLLLTLVAGEQFFDLVEALQKRSARLTAVDERVNSIVLSLRTSGGTTFFDIATDVLHPTSLSFFALVLSIIFIVSRRFTWAAYLVVSTGGGLLLMQGLKALFSRQRPDLTAAMKAASGYSFPSGHAMMGVVVFVALSYLAVRGLRRWRWIALVLSFSITSIIVVSLSRVYLGVHWISDIAGGFFAGILWTTIVTVGYELLRRLRLARGSRRTAAVSKDASEENVEAARQSDDEV